MSEKDSLKDRLGTVEDYVGRIGDDVNAAYEDELVVREVDGEELAFSGHRCEHGDKVYVVVGHESVEYLTIFYLMSLAEALTKSLPDEVVQAHVSDDTVSYEKRREIAANLMGEISSDEWNQFRLHTYLMASGGKIATKTTNLDNGALDLIEVSAKIFPDAPSFDISAFSETVQSVVSAGSRSSYWMTQSISIEVDDEAPIESEIVLNY